MRQLIAVLVLGMAIVGLFSSGTARADVNDFTITHFNSDQNLTRADKQGFLRIKETIDVIFTDNNHGIIRAIPASYKGNTLAFKLIGVTSPTGAPASVNTSHQSGNVVLRIGDPDKTVTGAQQYVIEYSVANVISFYDGHDELYWDVNGDEWNQPARKVTMTLRMPEDIQLSSQPPRCFSAQQSTALETCTVSMDGSVMTVVGSGMGPRQTLTYVMGFEKGYFSPPTLLDTLHDRFGLLVGLVALPLFALALGLRVWWRQGRDAPGRGVIIPQYEPPKGIAPLPAGVIMDFTVDGRDLTATFIDLAIRGYVRIYEQRADRLIGKDKVSYTLELRKSDVSGLASYEEALLMGLFAGKNEGDVVALGTPNSALQSTLQSLRTRLRKELTGQGMFRQFSIKGVLRSLALIAGAYIALGAYLLATTQELWPVVVGAFICVIIAVGIGFMMPARDASGVAAREHLLGLKLFMETTEKDRLAKLQAPGAAYAPGAGMPEHTVELFEKLLPYAIVLGVENQWAKQFAALYTTAPGWYDGTNTSFSTAYLASSLHSGFSNTLVTSFSSPSNSSGSGFGGGSSGGGGGGGGGGGW